MKTYQLNIAASPAPRTSTDSAPPFMQRCMRWAKATNEICGLIRGFLADGTLNHAEVQYFRDWIRANQELLYDPLVRALTVRVERVFADGVVSAEELEELKSLFQEYAEPGDGAPTTLPLDDPMPALVFKDVLYCFTGAFVSGSRAWCIAETEKRGARACNTINGGLHVLVIGTKVSRAWANQTYGRKIERAAAFRAAGKRPSIVNEDHWLKHLVPM